MTEHEATLLADLTDLSPKPRDTDKRIGGASWDGATGDYKLRLGHGNVTIGHGGALDMLASIRSHSLRADTWTSDGRFIRCDLHATDWSLTP